MWKRAAHAKSIIKKKRIFGSSWIQLFHMTLSLCADKQCTVMMAMATTIAVNRRHQLPWNGHCSPSLPLSCLFHHSLDTLYMPSVFTLSFKVSSDLSLFIHELFRACGCMCARVCVSRFFHPFLWQQIDRNSPPFAVCVERQKSTVLLYLCIRFK